jgi:signal transduction histidine kinase
MAEKLLEFLDHVATPVFVLDVDDEGIPRYSAFNECALHVSGFSLDNILSHTAREVYPGRGGIAAYERHLEVIGSGTKKQYEVSLPIAGEIRQIQTNLMPVKDETGNVIRLVGTSVDITDLRIGLESQAAVKTITNEMEDFITMAAHDLRTPMRNVQNLADMLREDFTDLGDGKLQLIDLLEDVALKATSLISDVLAHAQATKARQEFIAFEFGALCREITDIIDPLSKHNIKVSEGFIVGDKTAYQIILRNLLDNAIKHGGRDELEISILLSEGCEKMIEVVVSDNGKGFDNPGIAFLSGGKLRVDTGFGLLGIKRMIKSRGGDISAEVPDTGTGSQISFTLPGNFSLPHEHNEQRSETAHS